MIDRLGRAVLVIAVLTSALVLAWAMVKAFSETPPPATRHYVGLSWRELKRTDRTATLFAITPGATGLSIDASAWKCSARTVEDGTDFICDGRIFRYERTMVSHRIIAAGFEVPKGSTFTFGSGQDVDVQLRGPGVAAFHARLRSPCAPKDNALCLENHGASGTLAVYSSTSHTSRHPRRGEEARIAVGDEIWIGYVPLRLEETPKTLVFRVLLGKNGLEWVASHGDRKWQRLEMPAWSFRRTANERQTFVPEAALDRLALAGAGDLTATRVEIEQEEVIQKLIDHELLCLDRESTPGKLPRLRWRDPGRPGCEATSLQRDLRLAVPPEIDRLYRTARADRPINRFLAITARRLEEDEFVDDPTELPLMFDYRFKQTPRGLRRTPVRLIGIRPGVSFHRATAVQVADAAEPDIRFAPQSDSPRLEVLAIEPALSNLPIDVGMLLLLAPGGDGAQRLASITVGGSITANIQQWTPPACDAPKRQRCAPPVLSLGSAWFADNAFGWQGTVAQPAAGGVTASFDVTRHNGRIRTVMTPQSAQLFRNGDEVKQPVELRSGDLLAIGGITFKFDSGDGLAATHRQAGSVSQRVYPAGKDAVQLIGIGSRVGGIEASMTPEMEKLSRHQWAEKKTPIELTIRADLQHILARELNEPVGRMIRGTGNGVNRITGSAVLMNAAGDVLAVANAPTVNLDDPEELERTLSEENRRHSEDHRAAHQKIANHAFLRALPIGSTQKIATSLAQFREGRWPAGGPTNACGKHLRGYWLRTTDGKAIPLAGYDCHSYHEAVLPVGSQESWEPAFRDSCDVYFGLAALGLAPKQEWALLPLSGNLPGVSQVTEDKQFLTKVIFDRSDPSMLLRPGALDRPVSGDGNAYFETLLLLGFRFDAKFAGAGVNPQFASSYDGIAYPTAALPWLPGLAPQSAFVYPTVRGHQSYSSAYRAGAIDKSPARPVNIGIAGSTSAPKSYGIDRDQQWINYMMTAWGQNMSGSALSIAASALPIVNDDGRMPQPRIFAAPVDPAAPPKPVAPSVLDSDPATLDRSRDAIRKGLAEVVLNGTAKDFFLDSPVRTLVGGKTGTIEIALSEPNYSASKNPEALRRVFRYACGVLDAGATQDDWKFVLDHYASLFGRQSGWPQDLPLWAFAEGSPVCEAPFNPGFPRPAGGLPDAPSLASWNAYIEKELSEHGQTNVESSAFVAVALEPLIALPPARSGTPASNQEDGKGWVLGVIVDDYSTIENPKTAKRIAAAIMNSLQRYLEVRSR
ncbi:MAG TPA: hypothetical protein VF432_15770 [Thermoanaerobaculia bacterium]